MSLREVEIVKKASAIWHGVSVADMEKKGSGLRKASVQEAKRMVCGACVLMGISNMNEVTNSMTVCQAGYYAYVKDFKDLRRINPHFRKRTDQFLEAVQVALDEANAPLRKEIAAL